MRQAVLTNGTLLIASIHRSTENGKYVCEVQDNNGNRVFGSVQVQVMGNTYYCYYYLMSLAQKM